MGYDDVKEFRGRAYTGMPVGGEHSWIYPDARWKERKVAPDRWEFTLESIKRREQHAPDGSGAPVGTEYHWYILAHQRVRKVDADTYTTFMEGVKHKVAHRRPNWRRWSTEIPGRRTERETVVGILEAALAESKGAVVTPPPLQPTQAAAPSNVRVLESYV
ncbi:MAG TPA: hypothetical protein VEM95_02765 [Thermoplasmata archaeon]|nr:hypothetical protein [Thermoplasmata archaeon]